MSSTIGPVDIEFALKNLNFQAEAEKMKQGIAGITTAAKKEAAASGNAFKTGFGGVDKMLDGIGLNIGALAGPAAGVAAAFKFKQLAQEALEFENAFGMAMREVQTISVAVQGDFQGISAAIVDMAANGPDDAIKLAKAYYQIVSAGHDGAAGLELLSVASKAATAGVTDTLTAADGLTTVINAWALGADQANSVADVMFKTVERGKTTFGQLASSIAQVAPLASANGIGLNEIFAAIQSITKQGTPTAQAMTQIRSSIINMNSSLGDGWSKTMTYQEGLNKISEMAGGSATALKKLIPDVEGMSAVLALTGEKAKGSAEDLNETTKAAGAMETAYGRMMEEADNKWSVVHNKWTREMRALGKSMKEGSSMFANFLNDLLTNEKSDIIDPAAKKIVDDTAASIANLATKEEKLTAVIKKINELKAKRVNDILPNINDLVKQQPGLLRRNVEALNAGVGMSDYFTPGRKKQVELEMYNKQLAITQQAEKDLFKLYTEIAAVKTDNPTEQTTKLRTLQDITKEIEAAKKLQEGVTNKSEYDSIQKTVDKLEAEKVAITGIKDETKKVQGEYNKLEAATKKASDAVLNANEKERPALREKLAELVKQKQAWEDIIKAQRGETKGMKPIKSKSGSIYTESVDATTLEFDKLGKKVDETQKKAAKLKKEMKFDPGEIDILTERYEKQNEVLQQTVAFLNEMVGSYSEQLGLSEDQAKVLQNGMNAMKGMAQIASGNVIGGTLTLLASAVDMFLQTPEKMSEQFEGISAQIQKVITSLDIAEKTLSNLGKDSSLASIKIIKAEMLGLAEDAERLNEELSKSSTGRRRSVDSNLPATDLVKQAADLNTEIEKLSNRLLSGDISDDQRKSIEALLTSYNELLAAIDNTIQDITGTTVSDLSRSLADAFLSGEDSAEAWGQKVDDIIKNVIVRQLTAQLLTKPITEAVNALVNDSGNGLSVEEADKFQKTMEGIYTSSAPAFEAMQKALQAAGFNIGASTGSATGSTRGVSASATEDTISAMIGQLMAVRVDLKNILATMAFGQDDVAKNLFYMKEIAQNTSHNVRLITIESELKEMNATLKRNG